MFQRPRRIGGIRLAASVDLASVHPYATALVREAQNRGLALEFPLDIEERPGEGVQGTVAGRRVAVGSATFLRVTQERPASDCAPRPAMVPYTPSPAASTSSGNSRARPRSPASRTRAVANG